jgi:hypothetical protein
MQQHLQLSCRSHNGPLLSVSSTPFRQLQPWMEEYQKEIMGKTEEELIRMAGPNTESTDTRLIALYRLETPVRDSRNRIELVSLRFLRATSWATLYQTPGNAE